MAAGRRSPRGVGRPAVNPVAARSGDRATTGHRATTRKSERDKHELPYETRLALGETAALIAGWNNRREFRRSAGRRADPSEPPCMADSVSVSGGFGRGELRRLQVR